MGLPDEDFRESAAEWVEVGDKAVDLAGKIQTNWPGLAIAVALAIVVTWFGLAGYERWLDIRETGPAEQPLVIHDVRELVEHDYLGLAQIELKASVLQVWTVHDGVKVAFERAKPGRSLDIGNGLSIQDPFVADLRRELSRPTACFSITEPPGGKMEDAMSTKKVAYFCGIHVNDGGLGSKLLGVIVAAYEFRDPLPNQGDRFIMPRLRRYGWALSGIVNYLVDYGQI